MTLPGPDPTYDIWRDDDALPRRPWRHSPHGGDAPWPHLRVRRPRALPSIVRTGSGGDIDIYVDGALISELWWDPVRPDRPWPGGPWPGPGGGGDLPPFAPDLFDPSGPFDDLPGFDATLPCPDDDEPCPEPVASVAVGALMSVLRALADVEDEAPYGDAYHPTAIAPRCQLIVLLHGANGIGELGVVARAYAAAGYRVIIPEWPSELPLDRCCASLTQGGTPLTSIDPATWNDCLVAERLKNLTIIETQLVRQLTALDAAYPSDGWGTYLRRQRMPVRFADIRFLSGERVSDEPPLHWERIILAGYSSGANQSAFIARLRPVAGLILNSGGGDGEGPPPACGPDLEKEDWDPPLAAWMTDDPIPARDTFVGFRHAEEDFDFSDGWDTDGIPDSEVEVQTNADEPFHTPITSWDVLNDAKRVIRTGAVYDHNVQDATIPGPHAAVLEFTVDQANVNLYLACRAGGRP